MENQTPDTLSAPELTKRSKQEIDNEYSRCATLLGDKQFKIRFLSAEINLLMERMNQLNQEVMTNHPHVTMVPPPVPPSAL